MPDQFFPGFEDDDQPKPKPAAAKPPPAAAPPDPFAGMQIDASGGTKAPSPAVVPAAPGSAKPTKAAPPPAPPPPSADADADIKPGSRKDLWNCPHCGAGNRPERQTCRTCGKSPQDAVAVPLQKRPSVLIGVVAAVAVVVALIVMLTRADTSFRPPGPDHADTAVRRGGGAGAGEEVRGMRFDPKRQFAVVGRVIGVKPFTGGVGRQVVLALGDSATGEGFAQAKVVFNGHAAQISGADNAVVLWLIFRDAPPAVKPGDWLSLAGQEGALQRNGRIPDDIDANVGHVVVVDKAEMASE